VTKAPSNPSIGLLWSWKHPRSTIQPATMGQRSAGVYREHNGMRQNAMNQEQAPAEGLALRSALSTTAALCILPSF
jgi:hypothetical protein